MLNTRWYEKLSFSINILLYFENGARYGHSYNGRRIGTRMRSIGRRHFILNDPQISRERHYSTFNISNIAIIPFFMFLRKTKRPRSRTLTVRNVRLSNLLIVLIPRYTVVCSINPRYITDCRDLQN